MPFPLDFDSGLVILMAAFDIYLIIRFFQFRKQIIVRGTVPARLIMLVIICIVFCVQAYRGAFTRYAWAFNITVILAVLLIAVTPCGLSKEGTLSGVFPTLWSKIYYYEFEPYSEKKIRLRAHLATSERNLIFDKDKQAQAEAHLIANNVLSFAKYKELSKARREGRNSGKK